MITKAQAQQLGKEYNINFNIIDFDQWHYGLNVELEHGKRSKITNITDDNLDTTARIAIAHIYEFPDYYKRLKQLEEDATKHWHKKPNIFIS